MFVPKGFKILNPCNVLNMTFFSNMGAPPVDRNRRPGFTFILREALATACPRGPDLAGIHCNPLRDRLHHSSRWVAIVIDFSLHTIIDHKFC
jgi:hypothetical protein